MSSLFSGNRRYLALWFPYLSTDRLRRQGCGAPADAPLVVVMRSGNALRIARVDARARKLGLSPGLTLADVRARVPNVAIADDDPAADAQFLARLAGWCDRFTPLVGMDGESSLMLDITGCVHLFGGEEAMRAEVSARLGFAGLATQSAIAGTPDAARAVACYGGGGIIAPGGDAAATRPLSLSALGISAQDVLTLARAGLKTVADLADRPRAPLAARFGSALLERLMRVLGEVDHPISPNRPVPELLVEQRFAEPIGRAEDVIATLAGLAQNLATRLEQQGIGGRSFEASFFRADGAVRRIAVSSGRPLRAPVTLARLFDEKLDALADPVDPGFGFDMIRLAALSTEPYAQSQARFDGRERDDEAVADLTDRLSARFGADHVTTFAPQGSHIPERQFRVTQAQAQEGAAPVEWHMAQSGEPPLYPLRLFDPPHPIEAMAEVPDGPPIRFRWRRLSYDVIAAEGPDRIAPEWWRHREQPLTRDYFRVEDRTGHRFWLFREGLYDREVEKPRWFLHGLFA